MGTGRSLPFLRGSSIIAALFAITSLLLIAALVNYAVGGPHRVPLLVVGFLMPAAIFWLGMSVMRDRLDVRIESALGRPGRGLAVAAQDFPDYRFVDVYRAIEAELGHPITIIDSANSESLGMVLTGSFVGDGFPAEPARVARPVGPESEAYFPSDRYWIRPAAGMVVRLRLLEYLGSAKLEVAAAEAPAAEAMVTAVRERAHATSILRGHTLDLTCTPGGQDTLGQTQQPGKVKVDFRQAARVLDDAVVLDPRSWPAIQHSLVALHQNRAALLASGVPVKRGLLLYGPPGTGKSMMCRYLATLLPDTTMIYATGASLHHIALPFSLAREFQPSVIVLEDVDLVFASRDINVFGSALGDLFDQIDLLRDDEPISVILTTNAIERLEPAIKDRPGRISQCVYFGPPSDDLRRRCLELCLRGHDTIQLDLDAVVRNTEGATQAFLKELANRALQFAVEAGRTEAGRVTPVVADFEAALAEIRAFDERSVRAIVGFRPEN